MRGGPTPSGGRPAARLAAVAEHLGQPSEYFHWNGEQSELALRLSPSGRLLQRQIEAEARELAEALLKQDGSRPELFHKNGFMTGLAKRYAVSSGLGGRIVTLHRTT